MLLVSSLSYQVSWWVVLPSSGLLISTVETYCLKKQLKEKLL